MKKYSIISLAIFWGSCSISLLANQNQPPLPNSSSSFFSNKRLGIGLAGEYTNSEANLNITPATTLGNVGIAQSQAGNKLQVAPSIELGGTFANDYYMGVVFSWRYSSAMHSSRAPLSRANYFLHEYKLSQYADILLKPGYKFSPCTMLYGLFGPTIANWSHTSHQLVEGNGALDTFKMQKTTVGLALGIGFEQIFAKKYAFSIDYTYHIHRPVQQSKVMSYQEVLFGGAIRTRSGTLTKRVEPSYGTIALRFTMFFDINK